MHDDVMKICVHEIGHAVVSKALGCNVIQIVVSVGSLSGYCRISFPHRHHRYYIKDADVLIARAGGIFQRIFLMEEPEVEPSDYFDSDGYSIKPYAGLDYSLIPEPGSVDDEKQLNILLQTCNNLNFKAIRAAINALYATPARKGGEKVMSGRRFRKIMFGNGGFYERK